jgi:thiol-disulfide isomerase/thioredoxin
MSRLRRLLPMLALGCIGCAGWAGAEDLKSPPGIPDPYGLGQRLALVDYLKDTLHATVEPECSYQDLVALYWKSVDPSAAEAADARLDRIHQLQFRLKSDFAIDASSITDESALKDRLAQCESAATVHVTDTHAAEQPRTLNYGGQKPEHRATSAPAIDNTVTVAAAEPAGTDGPWSTDYNAAVTAARASGRPILIDFTGSDWCPWCIKLHDEVFTSAVFKDWASAHVVLLMADFPRKNPLPASQMAVNAGLARKYNVRSFPTVLIITADGAAVGRSGYEPGGAQHWVDDLVSRVPELK